MFICVYAGHEKISALYFLILDDGEGERTVLYTMKFS